MNIPPCPIFVSRNYGQPKSVGSENCTHHVLHSSSGRCLTIFCHILLLTLTQYFALQDDKLSSLCQKQTKLPICGIIFLKHNAALQHTLCLQIRD
jgi:hypothetical protein